MDRPTIIPLDDWRKEASAAEGKTPEAGTVKGFVSEVKADGDPLGRSLRFKLSDASVDRDNDTIDPNGWELGNYLRNPVVLWAHDSRSLPVAKARDIVKTIGGLFATADFAEYDFAETVLGLYRKGFMSAVSVGFRPLEYLFNRERGEYATDFKRQELLEFSCVPVPAHPGALIQARGAGIDIAPVVRWAEELLDEQEGIYLPTWFRAQAPKEKLAAAVREGKGAPVTIVLRQLDGKTAAEVKVGEPEASVVVPAKSEPSIQEDKSMTTVAKLREDLKRFRNVVRANGDATLWAIRGGRAEELSIEGFEKGEDVPAVRAIVVEEKLGDDIAARRAALLTGEKCAEEAETEAEAVCADEKSGALSAHVLELVGSRDGGELVYRRTASFSFREPKKEITSEPAAVRPPAPEKTQEPEFDPSAIDAAVKQQVDELRMRVTGRLD